MGEYFFGITDKGKRREKNEDTFIAREIPGKGLLVACVIDGVGGYSGGEIAAAVARNIILTHLRRLETSPLRSLHAAIIAADIKIREEKRKSSKNEKMACVLTCVVTDIKNNKLYYAHVGDTRLYLLRDRSLIKLSKDHSVVGFLEESGRLSEEDAMRHPRRNEITRALGFDEFDSNSNDFIESGESPFLPGDAILICSDGLYDMISSNTMLSILLDKKNIAKKAASLVCAANDAGGNDNITAVIVENNNQPLPMIARKPLEKKNLVKGLPGPGKDEPGAKKDRVSARHSRRIITFIIILFIGLAALLLFEKSNRIKNSPVVYKMKTPAKTTDNFRLFLQAVNDSSKKLVFNDDVSVINVSAPVQISKDSFYISGNGISLTADSSYMGPAILVNSAAKSIVLDSLVFKNFDVAVIAQKNNVVLRNVRFVNCRVPIAYEVSLSDTMLSGQFKDSIFIPLQMKSNSK